MPVARQVLARVATADDLSPIYRLIEEHQPAAYMIKANDRAMFACIARRR
eukprot:COSAG06_NODE_37040_length_440_cov_0.595308_1_plen_49_part_01